MRTHLVLAALVLFLRLPAFSQMPDKPSGFVTDAARVIPAADVKLLETRCARIDQTHRAQIAIVIVSSLEGKPIEQATLELFRKWGIGRKGIDNGIMLLLSVADRKSRLTVGYGLEHTISDSAAASILQKMQPDLRDGKYTSALNLALDSLEKLLPPSK